MKSKNKNICLLFAGGTTLNENDIEGTSVNKKEDIAGWLSQVPEITLMAKIDPVFLYSEKDELKGVELWQKINQIVYQKASQADGFVIITNINSVLDCGIASSFALKNLNKPVILTSSQITRDSIKLPEWQIHKDRAYGGLGVKANLINAVQIINMDVPAIALMFGNRIIRPVKAKRVQKLGLNLFESVDGNYLGKIDFGISVSEKIKANTGSLELKNQFASNIQVINYLPGLDFSKVVSPSAKGIIIRDLPNLYNLDLKKEERPILIYSPFIMGSQTSKKNIIIADKMTWETAVIKFMWVLGQNKKLQDEMDAEHCHELYSNRY